MVGLNAKSNRHAKDVYNGAPLVSYIPCQRVCPFETHASTSRKPDALRLSPTLSTYNKLQVLRAGRSNPSTPQTSPGQGPRPRLVGEAFYLPGKRRHGRSGPFTHTDKNNLMRVDGSFIPGRLPTGEGPPAGLPEALLKE